MRLRQFIVSCAILMGFAACNDVPVRNLTSSYSVQVQALRDKGTPAKLDILWVVDDSTSMCQEQQNLAASFKTFLDVFQNYTAIDMQLAVTTTNVCPKGTRGATRGKFVYQPATVLSPECLENKYFPCVEPAVGQVDPCTRMKDVPDPEKWMCVPSPMAQSGSSDPVSTSKAVYVCDAPAQVGIDDGHEGDVLFSYASRCRYICDHDTDTTECARAFGSPDGCSGAVCDGGCSSAECLKDDSLQFASDCPARCRGRDCTEVCEEMTGDAAGCAASCGKSGADCQSVCGEIQKSPKCDTVCNASVACFDKCERYFGEGSYSACQSMCEAASYEQCFARCDDSMNGAEFLCTVVCDTGYSCEERCVAEFGKSNYRCECPGNDCSAVGCVNVPATQYCPGGVDSDKNGTIDKWSGPTILNREVADYYAIEWIKGNWTAPPGWDPAWKNLPTDDSAESVEARGVLKEKVFEHLFTCMATVGTNQSLCGGQEQGLRAAWMALDPEGENTEQAKNFLRDDAYLLVVVVSDEDDCSAPEYLNDSTNAYTNYVDSTGRQKCSCLRDENGCLSSGECDYSKCLNSRGNFDRTKCPLYSSANMVNKIRSLKKDPAQVVFASIAGEAITGSTTSPGNDLEVIHDRFFECRCDNPNLQVAGYTYVCASAMGKAEYGKRYIDVAGAFGLGRYGQFSNICSEEGIGPALENIANLVVPLLTRVCLPRPMEWSCQGKCESKFVDSAKCSTVCGADDCFAECQNVFGGEPGCAEVCRSQDYVEIFRYDNKGECTKTNQAGECLPLEMITDANPDGDFRLVKNAPSCPLFDVTMGERPENAIEFKKPLGYTDKLEILYRASGNFCQDRCVRVFKDEKLCLDLCMGDTASCVEKCIKTGGSRNCSYVCEVSTDDCVNQCVALGYDECTTRCE